tara:strand:+ start:163 stop:537 length:375 start_codon:yes stop_codon:yes gene_type:complete
MENEKFQKLPSERQDLKLIHSDINNISDIDLQSKCLIIRNSEGEIDDPHHKTVPFLTKYEKARILGLRAEQINQGNISFIKTTSSNIYTIVENELKNKKIPFIIQRPLPNGQSEYWKVSDLELL